MGYLPGLDGIRAIAIVAVLLFHGAIGPFPGGFLGVDVFFVLSGFLITSLILEELDRSTTVNFGRFYLGRARRLLPALLLMLLVVGIAVCLVYRDAAYQYARDALASAFYVNNWWYINQHLSYFQAMGRPPLLQHLWSLAVEEQFYLIWPAIAFVVWRKWRRVGVGIVALVLATGSTIWLVSLSVSQGFPLLADPSRAYFGTDSHSMGLLVGAALASVWRPGRLSAKVSTAGRILITTVGSVALGCICLTFITADQYSPWLYRGGFAILAVAVAVLIASATHPAGYLALALGVAPLRYLGQRSYGLYLWHWPIFMVMRPGLDTPLSGVWNTLARLMVTFAVVEVSYRYVEIPIRRGGLKRLVEHLRSERSSIAVRSLAGAGTAVILLAVGAVGVSLASAAQPTATSGLAPDVAAAMGLANGGPTSVTVTAAPHQHDAAGSVTGIGDSVMLGARTSLQAAIPHMNIDAAVSRFPGAFIGQVHRLRKAGLLAPVVVIHAGTNGVFPEPMMRQLLNALADRRTVVMVNDAVPRAWNDPNDATIASVIKDYPNAVLADWSSVSNGHPEYFVSDGVHLTGIGGRRYAAMIKHAIAIGQQHVRTVHTTPMVSPTPTGA